MHQRSSTERLGAHVSVQGGVEKAPVRGKAIGATAIQVFTKTPSQWREPVVSSESYAAFQRECERLRLSSIVAHDSYLINLASPDPALSAQSEAAFVAELRRCEAFKIPYLVSHPGNYMDDRSAGAERNAAAYTRCLRAVPGSVVVLLETTAGCGTALGSTFEELAWLRELIGDDVRHRVAFCADTCHLYSAGYDLVGDYDGVWRRWDDILGLDRLHCLHLNDSKTGFASCRDRHEFIAEGSLGPQPFRRIMTDPRLDHVIKILETPKGDDQVAADRKMLRRLRRYARTARAILALVAAATTNPVPALHAQTDYYGRLGLTFTTDLVRDVIFREIHIRPALAPTIAVGASLPMAPRYRAGLEASLTSSGYHSSEGSTETDLGTLRTGSIILGLEGPLGWLMSWRGGVGLLRYWPTEDSGIFLQGGPTRFLAGAGIDFRPRVLSQADLMISVRYDFHRFTTDELRVRGFGGTQGVQRVSVSVGLARGPR